MRAHVLAALLLTLGASAAQAQLLPDNEARKAILELRASDDKLKQDIAAQNKDVAEQLSQIKRSLLELSSQLDQVRSELAKQRGANEQLARDVARIDGCRVGTLLDRRLLPIPGREQRIPD